MSHRVAVIDLGTNTFHLLIVDLEPNGTFTTVAKERRYVYLGGVDINHIDSEAFDRGLEALKEFRSLMDQHLVTEYKAIGTAALRTAKNNTEFVSQALADANINISIISGDQEAQYIAAGISQLYKQNRPHLVMDIGGGSVEFIKGNSTIEWFQSFKVGISILYYKFMKTEPISQLDLEQMQQFLMDELGPLLETVDKVVAYDLIGAAGTYEILAAYLDGSVPQGLASLDVEGIKALYKKAVTMTIEERKAIEGIPPHRAKYLVVSLSLIMFVLEQIKIDKVYVSMYSMKEGILSEFLDTSKN